MASLVDILNINNREIALGIWAAVFLVWALLQESIRRSLVGLLKAFAQRVVLLSTFWMLAYIAAMVFVFYKIGLWDIANLKDTLLWVFGVAFVILVNLNDAREEGYFRKTLADSAKLVVVLEFLVNLYAFELWIELIFMPMMILVGLLMGYASTDSKYKKVESFLAYPMGFFGIVVLAFTAYSIVTDFQGFVTLDNLRDLLLAPVFTLVFLPCVYLLALYIVYDSVFRRIDYLASGAEIARYAKRKTVFAFRLNLRALSKWLRSAEMQRIDDKKGLVAAIEEVKQAGA